MDAPLQNVAGSLEATVVRDLLEPVGETLHVCLPMRQEATATHVRGSVQSEVTVLPPQGAAFLQEQCGSFPIHLVPESLAQYAPRAQAVEVRGNDEAEQCGPHSILSMRRPGPLFHHFDVPAFRGASQGRLWSIKDLQEEFKLVWFQSPRRGNASALKATVPSSAAAKARAMMIDGGSGCC